MKTLIVYDSFFDNTKKIAMKVAKSLPLKDTKILKVNQVKYEDVKAYDILIAGSPTRAFRPSPDMKIFLKNLPNISNLKVAAFDTRMSVEDTKSRFLKTMAKMFGYAAEPITKVLQKKGGKLIIEPAGFYVKDTEGPLKEEELKRAKEWGDRIRALAQ